MIQKVNGLAHSVKNTGLQRKRLFFLEGGENLFLLSATKGGEIVPLSLALFKIFLWMMPYEINLL